jgi:hypothetical protein
MKKHIITLVLLKLCLISAIAQGFENYQPIRSTGRLPEDFTRAVADAARSSANDIPGKKSQEDKEFLLSTAFSLNRIMLGGKVLFNDPMAAFTNKVADELLKSHPELRAKVRIYIIKSPYVNAFATSDGAIFINIGLLAQLENEAQLAYILAHEIVHVEKKHSLDEYKKQTEISKGKGVYRDLNNSEKLLARSAYSKEKEQEADELGFLDYYERSGYSYSAIARVFDILKYGHLPIDEVPFDKSFFENPGFSFPVSYKLAELTPINTADEEDNEESSHPALPFRRDILEKMIKTRSAEGKKDYVIGESEFTYIRNMARFELCRLQLLDEDYNNAIYNSYVLLKEFPDNPYLLKIIGHSLFWISFNNNNLGKSFYKNVEGESQQLAHLLYKLSSKQRDIDMVNVSFALKLKQMFPGDKEVDLLLRESVKHTVSSHSINDKDLSEAYMNSLKVDTAVVIAKTETTEPDKKTEDGKKSKYQKIADSKGSSKTIATGDPSDSLNFYKYTVAAYMGNTQIKSIFKEEYNKNEEAENAKKAARIYKSKNSLDFKYGKAAGPVDKVIVVDPYYFGMTVGKDKKVKYLKNEQEEKDMVTRIEDCGKAAGVQTDIIEPKLFTESDVLKYNEMVILDEWLSERMLSDSRDVANAPETPVTSLGYNEIQKIIDAHGTEYAMWTVSLFEQRNRKRGGLIVGMVLLPPLIPIFIHRVINGGSVSHFMAIAFNLENGELKLSNQKTIWDNNYGYVKNSNIYFVFHQLKQTDKTK